MLIEVKTSDFETSPDGLESVHYFPLSSRFRLVFYKRLDLTAGDDSNEIYGWQRPSPPKVSAPPVYCYDMRIERFDRRRRQFVPAVFENGCPLSAVLSFDGMGLLNHYLKHHERDLDKLRGEEPEKPGAKVFRRKQGTLFANIT